MTANVAAFPKTAVNVRLSERQHVAVAALVAGRSIAQAASAAHVTPRTLLRWRGEPAFDAALRKARDAAFAETLAAVRRAASSAVATAEALLKPAHKAEVRIAAARALLAISLRANEAISIEERLAALEAKVLA